MHQIRQETKELIISNQTRPQNETFLLLKNFLKFDHNTLVTIPLCSIDIVALAREAIIDSSILDKKEIHIRDREKEI